MARRKTLTQQDILRALQSNYDVLKKYKVKRIGLFGSFAAGNQTPESDIDFLVEFHEPTFENFIGLVDYLEKTFGRNVEVLTPDGVAGIRIREIAQNIRKSVVYA
ncbi:MAG: nucleotidyltransferase family protein [Acidobacteriota bacterium]